MSRIWQEKELEKDFLGSSAGKESACNAGDPSWILGLGRCPGEGIGYSLQYSCLENSHGQRRLMVYSPWGCKEWNRTEWLSTAPRCRRHLSTCSEEGRSCPGWTAGGREELCMPPGQASKEMETQAASQRSWIPPKFEWASTKPPERNAPWFQPVFPWLENPNMLHIDSWSPERSIEYWKIVLSSWICGNLSHSNRELLLTLHLLSIFPHLEGFVVVQSLSPAQLFVTPWAAARQAPLSFIISWSLLKFMSIESVMPSSHLNLCRPSPPAFSFSQHQGLFQWVGSLAKVLGLQLSPSKEHSGLIS